MSTLSLRQALSISNSWVVLGVRDDTHVEQQNGINIQVGSYTEFQIHNVGNTPIAVTCEIRGASGQILLTQNVDVPALGVGRALSIPCSQAVCYLRSAAPFLVYAAVCNSAQRQTLPVYPLL